MHLAWSSGRHLPPSTGAFSFALAGLRPETYFPLRSRPVHALLDVSFRRILFPWCFPRPRRRLILGREMTADEHRLGGGLRNRHQLGPTLPCARGARQARAGTPAAGVLLALIKHDWLITAGQRSRPRAAADLRRVRISLILPRPASAVPAHLPRDGGDEDRGAFALPRRGGPAVPRTRADAGDEQAVECAVYCGLAAGPQQGGNEMLFFEEGVQRAGPAAPGAEVVVKHPHPSLPRRVRERETGVRSGLVLGAGAGGGAEVGVCCSSRSYHGCRCTRFAPGVPGDPGSSGDGLPGAAGGSGWRPPPAARSSAGDHGPGGRRVPSGEKASLRMPVGQEYGQTPPPTCTAGCRTLFAEGGGDVPPGAWLPGVDPCPGPFEQAAGGAWRLREKRGYSAESTGAASLSKHTSGSFCLDTGSSSARFPAVKAPEMQNNATYESHMLLASFLSEVLGIWTWSFPGIQPIGWSVHGEGSPFAAGDVV